MMLTIQLDWENALIMLPILVGGIFIIAGIIMFLFPPKKINNLYGYRTPSSMKNQERWDFAQSYSSKLMIKIGVIYFSTFILGFFLKPNSLLGIVLTLILFIALVVILFIKTEKAIKSKFSNKNE